MAETIKVTKAFKANFDLVCKLYDCTGAEIEEMRQCAREHMADAVKCFSALAKEKSA